MHANRSSGIDQLFCFSGVRIASAPVTHRWHLYETVLFHLPPKQKVSAELGSILGMERMKKTRVPGLAANFSRRRVNRLEDLGATERVPQDRF